MIDVFVEPAGSGFSVYPQASPFDRLEMTLGIRAPGNGFTLSLSKRKSSNRDWEAGLFPAFSGN